MADTALENAIRRNNEIGDEIADLRRRIEALKAEQERIGKFIEAWHEFADMAAAGDVDISSPPNDDIPLPKSEDDYGVVRRKRAVGNPKKEDVADASREIIAERGEPVSRAELFKALAERGVAIHSDADPEMVLSTMLWRMRHKVVRLKGGGYWLADKPNKDAGYFPDDKEDIFEVRDDTPPADFVSNTDESADTDSCPPDPGNRPMKWGDI